jgi:hypothetical protein
VDQSAETITPQAALDGTLTSWLALRDYVLWAFVQGVDESDPLSVIDLDQVRESVAQMNSQRATALHFSRQIAGKTGNAAAVLEAAIRVKLQTAAPAIPLHIASVSSAF